MLVTYFRIARFEIWFIENTICSYLLSLYQDIKSWFKNSNVFLITQAIQNMYDMGSSVTSTIYSLIEKLFYKFCDLSAKFNILKKQ